MAKEQREVFKTVGAPYAKIDAAVKEVQLWDRKLTKACDQRDEDAKLMQEYADTQCL